MSDVALSARADGARAASPGWWRNPWRKPRILQPDDPLPRLVDPPGPDRDLDLVQRRPFQQHAGRALAALVVPRPDGQALFQDPVLRRAMLQTYILSFSTMVLAVPLGRVRDRARPLAGQAATGANFLMLVTFVLPEIVIGLSMLLVVQYLFTFVQLGTYAQIMALCDLPDLLSRDHRARAVADDREGVRGGRHGPGRLPARSGPQRLASSALSRDPRKRRGGVRRHRGRLRHRDVPVGLRPAASHCRHSSTRPPGPPPRRRPTPPRRHARDDDGRDRVGYMAYRGSRGQEGGDVAGLSQQL